MADYLGKITITREATCGKCEQSELGLGRNAATELKQAGWRKIRGVGWVCPQCLKREARS